MSQQINYKPFDAATVPLQGSNLIEASAGTGKTYSIAILVLRLVLEQQLSVKEILMVTFTKAAVAELEERIRLFVRKAYKAAQGERIDDVLIEQLVAAAMEREPQAAVQRRLWTAVLLLDETSVLTIHSFCQITLSEFAFETGQVFGATLQQDSSRLLQEAVQECWRKHITTLPIPLLMALRQAGFAQSSLLQVLKEHLAGKRYKAFDVSRCYAFDDTHHQQWLSDLGELQKAHRNLVQCLEDKIADRKEALTQVCQKKAPARSLLPLLEKPAQFLQTIVAKRATVKYITELFADLLEEWDLCVVEEERYLEARQRVFDDLCCLAIQEARKHIDAAKQKQHLLTFDDLIGNLHAALVQRENLPLETALRNKYKAVFIDEFQDTDRQQYEVFEKAFGKDTLLFYIGDPKQSIYAWRKADIFTYFKARATVDAVYDMDRNFRSAAAMIEAMNQVFLPQPRFDTFYFKDESSAIDYHPVRSPEPNGKGILLEGKAPSVPISISEHKNKESLYDGVTGQVVALLTEGHFAVEKKDKAPRAVTPSDIGILVRTRKQAAEIRDRLQHYGIPAITVGDEKVLQSEEAVQLLYLLQAIEEPTLAHISRALLTSFTGVPASSLLQLDEEVATTLFRSYRTSWEQYGVYKALMDLAAYFNIRARLLQTPNGERILTNLVHLTELLHRVQTRNRLSPLELIAWLKRGVEGMEVEGDEYEQRIESDEEAVKIVTIHKSKGLEYNIVLAPHLDLLADEPHIDFVSYRHPDDGSYIGCEKRRLNETERAWVLRQTEQENRRLFYVALTRAVYKCFIFRSTAAYHKGSTLEAFLEGGPCWSPALVQLHTPPVVPEGYRYRLQAVPKTALAPLTAGSAVHFVLKEAAWVRSSFTGLALQKAGHVAKPSGAEHSNDYDRFMFQELEKGVRTGNMLHALLEVVDFTRDTRWEQQVQGVVQQFAPSKADLYQPMLLQMLQELLQVPLTVGDTSFSLSEVALNQRLHEFEFDMRVPLFSPVQLNILSGEGIQVQVKNLPKREGLLNGIMDLFFAYEGRYYILDWKSNYLGDRVSDYGPEQLAAAMNEHNYHLQYLLYTLAAVRYLRSRLGDAFDYERDFGGVIYLFVRGVRKEGGQGIFTTRPTKTQLQTLEQILCAAQAPLVQGVLIDAMEPVA
ncbi:DNA helicase/exodeoxyribonuclease V, beta subunit [Cnuella takakiae]|uniref:RecBCD enzyme subunit RecB n=1 Tax=Cnuella takakiae TaxID=1302690 RepID=A0A1M5J4K3_9BACT|nr:UvrD-helicase domain-containing protein [Cnuella takakiae]OLY91450.1 hypothetical protein BUE76_05685 [Cnuella takakiae]SHG35494.1 DNA helicase/exodeoxyribonuclease V, beta subunit [Cnuella takakiae]